jgi:hypothetical protein
MSATMAIKPNLPMHPSHLPIQHLSAVVAFPERPENFRSEVGFGNFSKPNVVPKQGVPRSPTYLFQAEWAETRYHDSVDAYYIHGRTKYWVIWDYYLNENADPWEWIWVPIGYCERGKIDQRTATMWLLFEFFKEHAPFSDPNGRPYEWINEEGILKVADIQAVCRKLLENDTSE